MSVLPSEPQAPAKPPDLVADALRVIDRALESVATTLAAIILIVFVGFYGLNRYAAMRQEMHAVAAVAQTVTDSFIASRPDSWEFASDRLEAKLEQFVPAQYERRVTGQTGIVMERWEPNNFMLTEVAPVHVFGVETGRIEIGLPLTDGIGWDLLAVILGSALFAGLVRQLVLRRPRVAMRVAETELRERNSALERARIGAEVANRAKSQFLSSMSHELRTPLNAVIGFSQLLQEDDELDAAQIDSAHEIFNAGQHLLSLVNDILDMSNIELGVMKANIAPVDATESLRESQVMVDDLIKKFGIRLTSGAEGDRPRRVLADQARLRQVLVNLLSNACKYNRPEGRVRTFIEDSEPGFVRIGIEDSGIGIPEDKQARVFEAFDRLDGECIGVEGTGVGLALVRRLVESMNGRVGFRSVQGQGSTFWIELPVAP